MDRRKPKSAGLVLVRGLTGGGSQGRKTTRGTQERATPAAELVVRAEKSEHERGERCRDIRGNNIPGALVVV